MAKILRIIRAAGDATQNVVLFEENIQGIWDVVVDRDDEGVTITMIPENTPNRIQLREVEKFSRADDDGEKLHYFRGVAVNGEIVFPSEAYSDRSARNAAAASLAKAFGCPLVDEPVPDPRKVSAPNPDVGDEELQANAVKAEEEARAAEKIANVALDGGVERARRDPEFNPELIEAIPAPSVELPEAPAGREGGAERDRRKDAVDELEAGLRELDRAYTKEELEIVALELGIELPPDAVKAQIVQILHSAGVKPEAPQEVPQEVVTTGG